LQEQVEQQVHQEAFSIYGFCSCLAVQLHFTTNLPDFVDFAFEFAGNHVCSFILFGAGCEIIIAGYADKIHRERYGYMV